MSYAAGDWVVDINTGRTGICINKTWCDVSVRFGKAVAIRYPEEIKLAPLDIRKDDLLAMLHLAVDTGDYEWFSELGERIGVELGG